MVSVSVCLITTLGRRYFKYLYKWNKWGPGGLSDFLRHTAEWLRRSSADCSTQKPGAWSLLYVTGLPACPDKWSLTAAGFGQCGLHPLVLVAPGFCGGGHSSGSQPGLISLLKAVVLVWERCHISPHWFCWHDWLGKCVLLPLLSVGSLPESNSWVVYIHSDLSKFLMEVITEKWLSKGSYCQSSVLKTEMQKHLEASQAPPQTHYGSIRGICILLTSPADVSTLKLEKHQLRGLPMAITSPHV